jgi:addiction module HigA family antidote
MTSKSSITTELLAPVHPGEVLSEEFLAPMGLSANALARRIGVPGNRVSMIVAGKRGSRATRRCGWRRPSARRRSSG